MLLTVTYNPPCALPLNIWAKLVDNMPADALALYNLPGYLKVVIDSLVPGRSNSHEICSKGSNCPLACIDLDNGLEPLLLTWLNFNPNWHG